MVTLRIPAVLRRQGDPAPDVSGFIEPIRMPVRIVWRRDAPLRLPSSIVGADAWQTPVADPVSQNDETKYGAGSGSRPAEWAVEEGHPDGRRTIRIAQIDFTGHGLGRLQQRGFSLQRIEDAIKTGVRTIQPNGNTKCVGLGVTVILNPTGAVVTCY